MSNILDRIDAFVQGNQITESAHAQLAVKMLKAHGMVPEGVNPEHIAKGIAKQHGVPMALVPQIVHYAAADLKVRDAYDNERLRQITDDTSVLASMIRMRPRKRPEHLKAYADHGKGGPHVESDSSADLPSRFEAAKDHAMLWHELATHPKKDAIINRAVHDRLYVTDVPNLTDEHVKDRLDQAFTRQREARSRRGEVEGTKFTMDQHHREILDRVKSYNPMRKESWSPEFEGGQGPGIRRPGEDPDNVGIVEKKRRAAAETLTQAARIMQDRKGLIIPYKPDAEHTHDGVTYRAYTLDTPEKADRDCWGKKFCIATGSSAHRMNEYYHGGTYKTAHIITRITKGDDGKPAEKLHAAYLPELLPGQRHHDPEQAVRNSGNNGPITGEEFKTIHPLLAKVDTRINQDAYFYRSGNFTDA